MNQGESFGAYHPGFSLYLIICAGAYIIFCWVNGGQTLGMKAWHLKLINEDANHVTWSQAVVRYLWGVLGFWLAGVGLLWCLVDKDRQTLADRFAQTRMVTSES